MFEFWKKIGTNKQLDEVLERIRMNVSNNYKDAAQQNLSEFEALLKELEDAGKLGEKQRIYYRERLSELKAQMKNFTHKDQKPTWV